MVVLFHVDASTLRVVVALKKWRNRTKQKQKPQARYITMLDQKLHATLPVAISHEIVHQVLPVLQKVAQIYKQLLGAKDIKTAGVNRHIDYLIKKTRYKNYVISESAVEEEVDLLAPPKPKRIHTAFLSAMAFKSTKGTFFGDDLLGRWKSQKGQVFPLDVEKDPSIKEEEEEILLDISEPTSPLKSRQSIISREHSILINNKPASQWNKKTSSNWIPSFLKRDNNPGVFTLGKVDGVNIVSISDERPSTGSFVPEIAITMIEDNNSK